MMNRSFEKSDIAQFIQTMAGMLILSIGINWFIVPSGLYTGGLLGLSQLFRSFLSNVFHLSFARIDIAGLIYQQGDSSEDSIFNVTGGTINDAQKIKNYDGENGGIVNILGAVKSQVRLDNYRGKTYVKNGGELQIAGSETSKIFTTGGNVNFENGSTLNLRESTIPAGQKFSPDNLVLAENDTLNLKMKDGLTLNVTNSSAKGNFSLK